MDLPNGTYQQADPDLGIDQWQDHKIGIHNHTSQ